MLPALSACTGADGQVGEQQPEAAAGNRQHEALGQQLQHQPAASGARARRGSRISFSRTDARTSSRLATLAQAIRTTTATAASSVSSAGRMSPRPSSP